MAEDPLAVVRRIAGGGFAQCTRHADAGQPTWSSNWGFVDIESTMEAERASTATCPPTWMVEMVAIPARS